MWDADLMARLRADDPLAALCGDRIAWFERARSTALLAGAVVMQKVHPGRDYSMDGPDGLDGPRVQFDCYGASGQQVAEIALALTTCIEAGGDQAGTRFHPGFLEGEQDWDPEDLGDQQRVFRRTLDFEFYIEAI